ncbi:conserved hypothetical protein (plasmid) [Cupriavidus taiwanensis LMG 19424]|nr:conserved hypothetical protein [Cupriavidus taiwanensis LMG 19424]
MGEQRFQQCKYKFAGSSLLASFRSQCSAVSVHSHFRASAPLGLRISVKVISGFGERDQGRKVVLRGQEIVA